jgi:hypothetical protein
MQEIVLLLVGYVWGLREYAPERGKNLEHTWRLRGGRTSEAGLSPAIPRTVTVFAICPRLRCCTMQ